jgi:uncharacterized membrane protein
MINTRSLVGSALIAAAALASTGANAGPVANPGDTFEKCYGIAAAGKNDCQTTTASCAGTAARDSQPDAWLYVPAGTCTKIAGGSMGPKS